MRQIYLNAISIVLRRIQACGKALQTVSDQYTLVYWQQELHKALHLKMRIESRIPERHNVLYVDFKNKKKVA